MRAIFGDIQAQLIDRERHKENSGRRAWQWYEFESEGSGELVPSEPLMFDSPFFEKPFVSYGHVLDAPPDRETFLLPMVTGGILRWVRNERKWWTGAYIYLRVSVDLKPEQSLVAAPTPRILHHFTFSATSYKPLSGDINVELQDLSPSLSPPGL